MYLQRDCAKDGVTVPQKVLYPLVDFTKKCGAERILWNPSKTWRHPKNEAMQGGEPRGAQTTRY